ncbi:discoidin domain-containing protein [Flavobacterium sp. LC2016-12]|uniref:discoidin domain-containing protein n=1 Tax=Flavobacterium sp. LC2016-12 TaxID=2783794 RepID=UPI00188AE7EC|nr:discoidin domain-containing protein [Flavobacterium sp. LC2016-12]MBF4466285.1 discoidin domain-containing protein [Flavobacterium sp. LC2016-12]
MNKNIVKIISLIFVTSLLCSCNDDETSLIEGLPDAIVNTDPAGAPPREINENWGDHKDKLYRQFFDKNVAVYYDNDVKRPLDWPNDFFKNTWKQVTNTYGDFGGDNRLYVVFHDKSKGTTYVGTTFNDESGNRSIFDLAFEGYEMKGNNIDNPLLAISQIVETSSRGINGSPAQAVWGNTFGEIFTYDIYTTLQMQADADRIAAVYNAKTENFPKENTYWFKDWYLPIYKDHGGSLVLGNFFKLAGQFFPTNGNSYDHQMNMGEFVHFFSGATGDDLQPLAEAAFGWSDEWQEQLLDARADFPTLNYPFEPVVNITDLTTGAKLTVSKDNGNGAEGGEGSLKLIDNDLNTKFLVGGLDTNNINFWMQQELTEAAVVNKYNFTSGNDAPDRDAKNWELLGSNDGSAWTSLDKRTNQVFSGRNQTREFVVENETAYKYYRINITANYGSDAIQISEWRQYYVRK